MCSSLAEVSLRQCSHSDRDCVDGGRLVVVVRLVGSSCFRWLYAVISNGDCADIGVGQDTEDRR